MSTVAQLVPSVQPVIPKTPQTPPPPTPPPVVTGPDWESSYPEPAWTRIRGEGIYLACVLLLAVVVTSILLTMRDKLATHPLTQELLCAGLGGITGSWIYAIKWYVKAVNEKIWRKDLIVWRLSSPFMGIFMAVSGYAIFKAGLLGISITASADPRLYAYGLGFLMGLFTDELMKKLSEVAKTLFGKPADDSDKANR